MSWNNLPLRDKELRGARVLVIEDEPLIALDLQSLLSIAGAEVLGPARSLGEGLQLAQSGRISAALLDVRIGRDAATPIAKVLHERSVPFAFYTGQVESEALRKAWPQAPIIAKPSPARHLVDVIERLCQRQPATARQKPFQGDAAL